MTLWYSAQSRLLPRLWCSETRPMPRSSKASRPCCCSGRELLDHVVADDHVVVLLQARLEQVGRLRAAGPSCRSRRAACPTWRRTPSPGSRARRRSAARGAWRRAAPRPAPAAVTQGSQAGQREDDRSSHRWSPLMQVRESGTVLRASRAIASAGGASARPRNRRRSLPSSGPR